jgi:hypothetical protein
VSKTYIGYRLDGKNVVEIQEGGETRPFLFPRVSVGWALSPGLYDWGAVPEEEREHPRGKKKKEWNKWGRVLELSRKLLSDVTGDYISDVTLRMSRYRAVRYFQKFAAEVLVNAGDTWEITEEEVKSWIAAWKNKKSFEIHPSGRSVNPEEPEVQEILDNMDARFEEYLRENPLRVEMLPLNEEEIEKRMTEEGESFGHWLHGDDPEPLEDMLERIMQTNEIFPPEPKPEPQKRGRGRPKKSV